MSNEAPSEFRLADRTPHPLDGVMLQRSVLSVLKPAVFDHQCGRPSLDPSLKCARPTPTHVRRSVIRGAVRCSIDDKGESGVISVDNADVGVNAQVGAAGNSENGEEPNE